jgi:hypothetical protein
MTRARVLTNVQVRGVRRVSKLRKAKTGEILYQSKDDMPSVYIGLVGDARFDSCVPRTPGIGRVLASTKRCVGTSEASMEITGIAPVARDWILAISKVCSKVRAMSDAVNRRRWISPVPRSVRIRKIEKWR